MLKFKQQNDTKYILVTQPFLRSSLIGFFCPLANFYPCIFSDIISALTHCLFTNEIKVERPLNVISNYSVSRPTNQQSTDHIFLSKLSHLQSLNWETA